MHLKDRKYVVETAPIFVGSDKNIHSQNVAQPPLGRTAVECMSSPQTAEMGPPLTPLYSTAPPNLAELQRCTRPFSASDGRGGDLLTILVHCGRHLESLVVPESQAQPRPVGSTESSLNTYVVATVGHFATSPKIAVCSSGHSGEDDDGSARDSPRVFYDQRCSPYAATRVIEGSESPMWNELLAVPLPSKWNEVPPQKQEDVGQQEFRTASQERVVMHLALKLELVERGSSHQEDFLLASCVLPLTKSGCHLQQKRFAIAFPSVHTGVLSPQRPQASIQVSLYASSREFASNGAPSEHIEITVESFMPGIVTGCEEKEALHDYTGLAALVSLHAEPEMCYDGDRRETVENYFDQLSDGQILQDSNLLVSEHEDSKSTYLAGITPSSQSASGSSSGVYEWFFPLSLTLHASPNAVKSVVDIALFVTSSIPNKLLGRGRLDLSSAQAVRKDGSSIRHTVIPVVLDVGNSRTLGHLALRLRWWNSQAWKDFVEDTPARRIVCTNRRMRSPRRPLAWMGALLRGLNRHPVASFCDAGGISGVLAEFIADSSAAEGKQRNQLEQEQQKSSMPVNSVDPVDANRVLLREQLSHLQTEGVAQRHHIERLQRELDIRLDAIKTCGLEIVALRRESQRKDEQLQKLNEQVEAAHQREQQQLAELLTTNTNGSALVDPEFQSASQRFNLLTRKYKELDQEHRTTKEQLADAQRSLTLHSQFEARHAKLQEAHLVQSALVQRLQRDKQETASLRKTVRMQEKVIQQFEQAIAQQSREVPETCSRNGQVSVAEQPNASDRDTSDIETQEALLQVRVQVLERQLETNARQAASEMNALRMRILELETAERRHSGK